MMRFPSETAANAAVVLRAWHGRRGGLRAGMLLVAMLTWQAARAETIQQFACAPGAWKLGASAAAPGTSPTRMAKDALHDVLLAQSGGMPVNFNRLISSQLVASSLALSAKGVDAPLAGVPDVDRRVWKQPRFLPDQADVVPIDAESPHGRLVMLGALVGLYDPSRNGDTSLRIASDDANRYAGNITLSPDEQRRLASAQICNDTIRALNQSERNLRTATDGHVPLGGANTLAEWASKPGHGQPPETFKTALANLASYDERCLNADARPAELKEVVGVLTVQDKPACTAFRRSANRIWTARHCLYADGDNSRLDAIQPSKVWFSYPGQPNARYEVCAETRNSKAARDPKGFQPKDDYIELQIAGTPPPPPDVTLDSGGARKGADLTLLGLFTDLQLLGKPSSGLSYLRGSRSGCVVDELTRDGCIVHGCQAVQGTSGAPVFVVRDGKLVLVGMHIRGGVPKGDVQCAAKEVQDTNYNLAIPVKLLAD
ncbi:hypothetical protein WT14_12320 [Burkholderia stagnalis]|nr:hypothetical protein WT14_12320 [Burkholderia stagnalis]